MCGRYSFFSKDDVLENRFHAQIKMPLTRHYNAAPSQNLPVILNDEPESIVLGLWIDTSADLELALETLKPYPPDQMQMYKVSPLVNAVRNDTPGVIVPV